MREVFIMISFLCSTMVKHFDIVFTLSGVEFYLEYKFFEKDKKETVQL